MPDKSIIIRNAKYCDSPKVRGLYKQLHANDITAADYDWSYKFKEIVNSRFNHLFILEYQDNILATCYLNIIPNLTRGLMNYAVIENVVTHKDHRNNGYGKKIVMYAISKAWNLNCYKVMLMTSSKEEATLSFYKSCGFEKNSKTAFIVKR